MKYKIINNSGSPMNFGNEVQSLCGFAQDRFGFKKPPSIVMNDDQDNANKLLGKTGYYDPETLEIHVFITGRHPKDILRSIAHELVHHFQNEKGELSKGEYSGPGYAQKDPHLRNMEMQANDPMLFRDWEDSLKEKQPTIYNERRNRKMSLKEWKNKELGSLLTERWGFKMNLNEMCGDMHHEHPMEPEGVMPEESEECIELNGETYCKEEPIQGAGMEEMPVHESSAMSAGGGSVEGHSGNSRTQRRGK